MPSNSSAKTELEWFGTARARLGFAPSTIAYGRLLFFVTGGVAYGEVNDTVRVFFNPPVSGLASGSESRTRAGWTAGAGAEYALIDNVSLKAEYLFVDLGDRKVSVVDPVQFPPDILGYRFDSGTHVVRAGVNVRFGSR